MTAWRVLRHGPRGGAANMAVDHALAASWQPGEAVLRLYEWAQPTVSLGRNQPARDAYDRAAAERAGLHFVRRPTGGRAVLHDRELTYAVVVDPRSMGGARAVYVAVHRALLAGLAGLAVPAELVDDVSEGPALDHRPCFSDPAPGEIHVQGRKLVGSAQARLGGVVLQHGSILLVNDQAALRTLEAERANQATDPAGSVVTLAALTASAEPNQVADAVVRGFERALGIDLVPGEITERERERTLEFETHYRDPAWTWRR